MLILWWLITYVINELVFSAFWQSSWANAYTFSTRDNLRPILFKYTCHLIPFDNCWGLWHSQLMLSNSNQFSLRNKGIFSAALILRTLVTLAQHSVPEQVCRTRYFLLNCWGSLQSNTQTLLLPSGYTHNSGAKYSSGRLWFAYSVKCVAYIRRSVHTLRTECQTIAGKACSQCRVPGGTSAGWDALQNWLMQCSDNYTSLPLRNEPTAACKCTDRTLHWKPWRAKKEKNIRPEYVRIGTAARLWLSKKNSIFATPTKIEILTLQSVIPNFKFVIN